MKTSTQRTNELRAKRKKAGLGEIRGLWAKTDEHKAVKTLVREFLIRNGRKP